MRNFLLICLIGFSNLLIAQDWALFPFGQKSVYLKQDTSHTIEVMVADSIQGDTYYFNRKTDLAIDQACVNNVYEYYYDGPYITVNNLDSIIEKTDTSIFYCKHTSVPFIFLKNANPGDSWIIDSDVSTNTISAIEITCIEASEEMIFETMDSIKKFQLNVPDNPDSPINDYIITLSKNFGFIDFIMPIDYLYNPSSIEILPYKLIGYEKTGDTVGYNLPQWNAYFNLQAGDKLYWEYSSTTTEPTTTTIIKYYQDSLTEVVQSLDEITYIYDRKVLNPGSDIFVQNDLIENFSSDVYKWFVNSPTKWFTFSNDEYSMDYGFTIWDNTSNSLLFSTDFLDTTITRKYYTEINFLDTNECFIGEVTDVSYNISLNSFCGINSFGKEAGGWYFSYENQHLIGFQIGDSIWGAQELPTSIIENDLQSELIVFPNPVSNIIYTGITITHPLQYSIYNLQSQLIKNGMLTENTISVADITSGIYLLEIRDDENVYRGKFVVE